MAKGCLDFKIDLMTFGASKRQEGSQKVFRMRDPLKKAQQIVCFEWLGALDP
jgi:hypothetical protein